MKPILSQALDAIAEESPDFDVSFGLVDQLVVAYGETNLAARLYNEIDASVSWRVVADLFAILIWFTNDNGHSLMRTMERWLTEANDLRKIRIAVNLDAYPFASKAKMAEAFHVIKQRFPEIANELDSFLKVRPDD